MDRAKLKKRLIQFYILEKFQVAYYGAQLSASEGEYYRQAFTRLVQVETEHANFFEQQLIQYNFGVPDLTTSLFKYAGAIIGESVELTGPDITCKLGVAFESKAMEMYRSFILEAWDIPNLRDTLWNYLIDEELHKLWLQRYGV